MIKAFDLTGEFIKREMNFEIKKGSKTVFIFEKEEQGSEFLKLITGIKNPEKGEIIFMGKNLKETTRDDLFELRRKTGIVFKTGGLISNLKAWENLILPAVYHKVDDEEKIIKRGMELLKKLEFKKEPMSAIAELTNFEKRIIAIARAVLMNPEIFIFEYPFDGAEESEKKWLIEKIQALTDSSTMLYILGSERESLLIEKADVIKYAEN
ncbi:ATP-binding cassette domain-containing protein [Thermodesulfovibrio sp. 3907-1M]|uniref:ATP-binding cassette domain-containing protein n=1 Tax=Thermodesulfovibrio autotrophicus TaxID=3118333 RepID=A0AAU8GXJ8_9BACT